MRTENLNPPLPLSSSIVHLRNTFALLSPNVHLHAQDPPVQGRRRVRDQRGEQEELPVLQVPGEASKEFKRMIRIVSFVFALQRCLQNGLNPSWVLTEEERRQRFRKQLKLLSERSGGGASSAGEHPEPRAIPNLPPSSPAPATPRRDRKKGKSPPKKRRSKSE